MPCSSPATGTAESGPAVISASMLGMNGFDNGCSAFCASCRMVRAETLLNCNCCPTAPGTYNHAPSN
jgi:hypothetical protein